MDPAGVTSSRSFRFALAGAALIAFVLVVAIGRRSGRAARAAESEGADDSARAPVSLTAPVDDALAVAATPRVDLEVATPADPPPHQQTAREFLAQYYGSRWPETREKLESAGLDLDQPYRQVPWEDVEAEFESRIGLRGESRENLVRDQVRWPEELTAEFLNETFPLPAPLAIDQADVPAIEALVASKNDEIGALAEYYGDLIDHLVHENWRKGDFVRAPFTTTGLSEDRGFHTQTHAGAGWAVTITLSNAQYPEAAEIQERMSGLWGERSELVSGYLRAKFRR